MMETENYEAAKLMVVEMLQRSGAMDTMKAQMRATVFNALQSNAAAEGKRVERSQEGMHASVRSNRPDRDLVFLIQDFLKAKGLVQTASVLSSEWV